jgi:hypothetical protein
VDNAVEPTKSQNKTVNCRRSAAEGGGGTGNWQLNTGHWCRARPHQHLAVFVLGQTPGVDQVSLNVFEVLIVEREPTLQCPIGNTPFSVQEIDDLSQHFVECRHQGCFPGVMLLQPGVAMKERVRPKATSRHCAGLAVIQRRK